MDLNLDLKASPQRARRAARKHRMPRRPDAGDIARTRPDLVAFFRTRPIVGFQRPRLTAVALVGTLMAFTTGCSSPDNRPAPTAAEVAIEPATRIAIGNAAGYPADVTIELDRGWHALSLELRRWPEDDEETCIEVEATATRFDDRIVPSADQIGAPNFAFPTKAVAYVVHRPESPKSKAKVEESREECSERVGGHGKVFDVRVEQMDTTPLVGSDAPAQGVAQAVQVWNPPESAYVEVNYVAGYNAPMRVPVSGVGFSGDTVHLTTTPVAAGATCVDISIPQAASDTIRTQFLIAPGEPAKPAQDPCPQSDQSKEEDLNIRSL